MSGYLQFDSTGCAPVDEILHELSLAGDAYHHTEQWSEECYDGLSCIERISAAAVKAKQNYDALLQQQERLERENAELKAENVRLKADSARHKRMREIQARSAAHAEAALVDLRECAATLVEKDEGHPDGPKYLRIYAEKIRALPLNSSRAERIAKVFEDARQHFLVENMILPEVEHRYCGCDICNTFRELEAEESK